MTSGPEAFRSYRTDSRAWFEELQRTGRLASKEGDLLFALGVEDRPATVYSEFPNAYDDLRASFAVEGGADLTTADTELLVELVGSAIRSGSSVALKGLIGHRFVPGEIGTELAALGQSGMVVWDETGPSFWGAGPDELCATLKVARDAGVDIAVRVTPDGETFATNAAARNPELVRRLLAAGVGANDQNVRGQTPLAVACMFGQRANAKLLIEAGALIAVPDVDGKVALHEAANSGDLALVDLLLAHGADVAVQSKSGITPLMLARSVDVVRVLRGADADVDARTTAGETALTFAAGRLDLEVVELLLASGADPSVATDIGISALHFATLASLGDEASYRVIGALLDAGAPIDEETNDGVTPLIAAAMSADPATLAYLIGRGAKVDARTLNGNTALIMVSDGQKLWSREFDVGDRMIQCVELLVQAGADINAANDRGETALLWATTGFDSTLVEALLKFGADPNIGSDLGAAPLASARQQEHEAMITALVAAGATDTGRAPH